ncbi:hypothetical protein ACVBEF_07080 [Glaciimonas sp. GG7]
MRHLIVTNLLFFIPMALCGLVLFAEVPVHSKVAHGGLCTVGLVVGAMLAMLLLEVIAVMI